MSTRLLSALSRFSSVLFIAATGAGCAHSSPAPAHGGDQGAEAAAHDGDTAGDFQTTNVDARLRAATLAPRQCAASDLGDTVTEYRIEPLGWAYRTVGEFNVTCGPEIVLFQAEGLAIAALTLDLRATPIALESAADGAIEAAVNRTGGRVVERVDVLAGVAETPSICARVVEDAGGEAMESRICLGRVELDEARVVLITVFARDSTAGWAESGVSIGDLAGIFFDNLLTKEELAAAEAG